MPDQVFPLTTLDYSEAGGQTEAGGHIEAGGQALHLTFGKRSMERSMGSESLIRYLLGYNHKKVITWRTHGTHL